MQEMPRAVHEVTVEEIDCALQIIAAGYRFSSPDVRSSALQPVQRNPEHILARIFVRLQSREAKWFTRMILKSYLPVVIPEYVTFRAYHFLLPAILKIQSSFGDALDLLDRAANNPISKIPPRPPRGMEQPMLEIAMKYFEPKIGVKVGRATFFKARVGGLYRLHFQLAGLTVG
jgi:DNA ligase-4